MNYSKSFIYIYVKYQISMQIVKNISWSCSQEHDKSNEIFIHTNGESIIWFLYYLRRVFWKNKIKWKFNQITDLVSVFLFKSSSRVQIFSWKSTSIVVASSLYYDWMIKPLMLEMYDVNWKEWIMGVEDNGARCWTAINSTTHTWGIQKAIICEKNGIWFLLSLLSPSSISHFFYFSLFKNWNDLEKDDFLLPNDKFFAVPHWKSYFKAIHSAS